jgi:hypothetical protein
VPQVFHGVISQLFCTLHDSFLNSHSRYISRGYKMSGSQFPAGPAHFEVMAKQEEARSGGIPFLPNIGRVIKAKGQNKLSSSCMARVQIGD